MKSFTRSIHTLVGITVFTLSVTALPAPGEDLPGSGDAIEKAVEQAAQDAANEIIDGLPTDVRTIALFPLFGDSDGSATAVFEEAMTKACADSGLKLVTRSDSEWLHLTSEWKFTEDNVDVMPELPEFRNVYPAGAMAWGRLRYARIDDSEIKAQARIEIKVGMPGSGVVGTSIGNGLASIDPETFWSGTLMRLTRQPWFWIAVVIGMVAATVLIMIVVPLKRKMALAAKPRKISH